MGKLRDRIERILTGYTSAERADIQRRYIDSRADAGLAALVDDLEAHFEEDVAAERIAANLASIESIPADMLPAHDPSRVALVALIRACYDCRAYASGLTWILWLDPLAEARDGGDGRVSIAGWRISWRDLLAEMGLSAEAMAAAEGRVTA